MKLDSILNKPGDEPPPRRPRLSSSYSKDSQSPPALDYRQNSTSISTPISPYPPGSAHPSTPYGYSSANQPTSALSLTPSSSQSYSVPPQTYQPTTSTQLHPPPISDRNYLGPQQPQNQYEPPTIQAPIRTHSSRSREDSLSVSPKTVHSRLSSQSQPQFPPQTHESQQSNHQNQQFHQAPAPSLYREPNSFDGKETPHPPASAKVEPIESPGSHPGPHMQPPAVPPTKAKRPLVEEPTNTPAASEPEPQKKKRRVGKIPIWAQPAKNLRPLPKYSANGSTALPAATVAPNATASGSANASVKIQPDFGARGPLGAFEESFRGDFIPHEELTKQVCDFLFRHVVLNKDMATGRMGEAATIEGQLEIEAKIGTIIDRRTDQRLAVPVTSEAILRQDYAVAFESMMTESQHKSFNELLNEALKESLGPPTSGRRKEQPKSRIKMTYEHRHEVDAFYDLPDDELSNLPPALQSIIKQSLSHKPKLRITREKNTGQVLAKIVKARIADMHVFSPSTSFDWRISVNLEATWNGDLDALVKAASATGVKSNPDRNKDRMSYTHLFCHIDLTQVKGQTARGAPSTTHELEVELDSATVREQGILVMSNQDNQYQELVKAFVDNVRILVRGVQ